MKKVLLTGSTGFLGRNTIPFLLRKKYEVHAVYLNQKQPINKNDLLHWHRCNLLRADEQRHLFEKISPTHLLHFAWETTPGKYWTSRTNLLWVQSSLEILMNFAGCGGKRAVISGSCAEYDWSYGCCSENSTPMLPSSLYGSCKNSLQEIVKSFSLQEGISSAWGRIFFLYGPYEYPGRLVPSIICSLLKMKIAYCSHGKQIRDFLFIEDAGDAFVKLLESDVTGPVNIASGLPISIKEIVNKIAKKIGNDFLIKYGTVQTDVNEPHLLIADTTRLNNEVGWLPKYDLDLGLEKTIEWWASYLHEARGEFK